MNKIEKLIKDLCPDGVDYLPLGVLADIGTGASDRKNAVKDGKYPFYVRSKDILRINNYEYDETAIIIPGEGSIGEIFHYAEGKYALHQRAYRIFVHESCLNPKYLLHYMKSAFKYFIVKKAVSATVKSIRKPMLVDFPVPVPPMEVQEEIVKILDSFTELESELESELEVRKKQYSYYRDKLLTFDKDDPNVECGKLNYFLDYIQPGKYIVKNNEYNDEYLIPVLTAGQTFILGYTDETDGIYDASKENPVIIFDDFTTSFHWVDFPFKVKSSALKILTPKYNNDSVQFRYIYYAMKCIHFIVSSHARHWISVYSKLSIPIPPLSEQERIVKILDKFDALVNDINKGLPAEIDARHKQYEYYRDKLLTFPKK